MAKSILVRFPVLKGAESTGNLVEIHNQQGCTGPSGVCSITEIIVCTCKSKCCFLLCSNHVSLKFNIKIYCNLSNTQFTVAHSFNFTPNLLF